MLAKDARRYFEAISCTSILSITMMDALRVARTALRNEEDLELVHEILADNKDMTDLDAQRIVDAQVNLLGELLRKIPTKTVRHIGFMCDAEMQDRRLRNEQMEKECEA